MITSKNISTFFKSIGLVSLLAAGISGTAAAQDGNLVYRSVDRTSANAATIGRAAAVADLGWIRFAGWTAWLFWLFVHIIKLTGFRNRLVVLVQWAWAYFTFQRSVRLITGRAREARPPAVTG